MSVQLKERTTAEALFDIGKLEQGFVFGDATATYKALANVINEHPVGGFVRSTSILWHNNRLFENYKRVQSPVHQRSQIQTSIMQRKGPRIDDG